MLEKSYRAKLKHLRGEGLACDLTTKYLSNNISNKTKVESVKLEKAFDFEIRL